MTIEWRKIPNFSNYSVSNSGLVRRDNKNSTAKPGLCSISTGSRYDKVSLTRDDGKYCTVNLHSILMAAFVGPLPQGMHVCHCDGNPKNNSLDNLRYDTPKANVHDAIKHGTQVYGEKVAQHILSEHDVQEILGLLEQGATYVAIAEKFSVTNHCIFRIAAGKTWRHLTGGKDRRNGYKYTYIGGRAAKEKRQQLREAQAMGKAFPTGEILGGYRVWKCAA